MRNNAARSHLRCGITFSTRIVLLVGLVLVVTTPAAGLWLPWTTERDKIQKIANDVWDALVKNDLSTVSLYVSGDGSENFIKQEMNLIKNLKIEDYECYVRQFQLDAVTGARALVVLEKVATQQNGRQLKRTDMSVFRKIGGQWKIVMEKTRKKRRLEEIDALDEGPPASERDQPVDGQISAVDGGSAPSGPEMNIPSLK